MYENKFKSQDDDEEDNESKKSDCLLEDQCNLLLKKTVKNISPGENWIGIEHKVWCWFTYSLYGKIASHKVLQLFFKGLL